ncbi:MAG TPA: SGNH hydrolase domain-containing protein [Solirubrobacteraceae bacterium]|jgi:hypothetical protein|nr:SGNH hydrolase domain-containing protein [Solirubrobacteraceae bacterium]
MRPRRFFVATLAALALIGPVVASETLGQEQYTPSPLPCFGALSRSLVTPCQNPALRLTVIPTPQQALLSPAPPCLESEARGVLLVCHFGAPRDQAPVQFALVGDSHAWHWTGAAEIMAHDRYWYGYALTRASCPFTLATITLASATLMGQCSAWHLAVLRWFQQHPQVSIVLVSEHAQAAVVPARGEPERETIEDGYIDAWHSLPRTVRHIVVIRDVPQNSYLSISCVESALARHLPAETRCALSRSSALTTDPAVLAAERMHSPRVSVVDLTHYFCSATQCFTVIGGALVYRDIGHLTDQFSASMGTFLMRAVERATGQ